MESQEIPYPKIGDLVWYEGPDFKHRGKSYGPTGYLAKVIDTWTEDSDFVPDWTDEDSDIDVLIMYDGGKKKAVSIATLTEYHDDIVSVNVDEAWYVGDEDDGIYIQAELGPDGWYVSSMVDSNTGGFVDAFSTDDGPYKTEKAALGAAASAAADWYYESAMPPGPGQAFDPELDDPIPEHLHKKIGW